MTLYQLRIIHTLLNNQLSVSTTAKKLYRAQSAISHQLHLLEEEFSGRLFERSGKRLVRATRLCLDLLPEINTILQAESNIQVTKEEYAKKDYGDLRVATTYTQARYFLPEVIETFRNQYPHVKFIFLQDNPVKFPQMLKLGEIDFAIYAEELEPDVGLKKIACYRWNRSLVMQRSHPLSKIPHPKLTDIAKYPIITYIPGFFDRTVIEQAFKQANVTADIIFSASDTEIIKTYVGMNLGIGIVAQMAHNLDTDQNLVFHSLNHLFKDSLTRVVYMKGKVLRKYMHDFIKYLCAHGERFQEQLTNRS